METVLFTVHFNAISLIRYITVDVFCYIWETQLLLVKIKVVNNVS